MTNDERESGFTPARATMKKSLELVVVAVDHGGHRIHLFREHAHVQLSVALLNHAAQKSRRVDAALGLVDGAAITPHLGDVTGCAFVFGDEFFTEFVVGILEDGRLGLGQITTQKAKPCQDTRAENFHSHFPIKKALSTHRAF